MRELSGRWELIGACSAASFLFLCALIGHDLFVPSPLTDEFFYRDAGRAVLAGTPLTEIHGWFYSPAFAYALAAAFASIGERPTFLLLRSANAIGFCAVLAVMATLLGSGFGTRRWITSVLVVVTAAVVCAEHLFSMGNVSGILVIPLFVAMATRRAWVRTLALCAGAPIKPYAFGPALTRTGIERAIPILLMLLMSATASPLANGIDLQALNHVNVSACRFLSLVAGVPWQVTAGSVLVFGVLFPPRGWARGMALSWFALPIVWPHTTLALLGIPWAVGMRNTLSKPRGGSATERLSPFLMALSGVILLQAKNFGLYADGLLGTLYRSLPMFSAMIVYRFAEEAEGNASGELSRATAATTLE